MDFEYVTGWYSKKTGQVKPLGGFPNLKAAKEFSETVDPLFWGNGFLFIDSPEGIHIKGEENFWGNKQKWYSPEGIKNDEVKLFHMKKNGDEEIIRLDSYLPYDDYKKFTQGNVFKEPVQQNNKQKQPIESSVENRDSVLSKLSDNKEAVESRYTEHTQKEKTERQINEAAR